MHDLYKNILEEAVWAPSGDNSQPWHFKIIDNRLQVFAIPVLDNPILNVSGSGTYIANGALIENLKIAASHHGFSLDIELFPDTNNNDLVATIKATKDPSIENDFLFPFIRHRHTNRRAYKSTNLTIDQKNELLNCINKIDAKLLLIEDKQIRKKLSLASSIMERIALENRELHKLFFSDIVWDRKKHIKGESGLYIKTLELPLPIQYLFKVLKNWRLTNFLNKIGFSRFASKSNAGIYATGAAIGVITISKHTPRDFINAGMAMQRVWLTCTKLGLSLQPVTGVLFLGEKIKKGDPHPFSEFHVKKIIDTHKEIKGHYSITDDVIAMMFRIGVASKVSDRTYRKPAVIHIA